MPQAIKRTAETIIQTAFLIRLLLPSQILVTYPFIPEKAIVSTILLSNVINSTQGGIINRTEAAEAAPTRAMPAAATSFKTVGSSFHAS